MQNEDLDQEARTALLAFREADRFPRERVDAVHRRLQRSLRGSPPPWLDAADEGAATATEREPPSIPRGWWWGVAAAVVLVAASGLGAGLGLRHRDARPGPHQAMDTVRPPAPVPRTATRRGASVPSSASVQPVSSLTDELILIEAANAALAAGDLRGAREALEGYARRFPEGQLGIEARGLQLVVRCREGDPRGEAAARHYQTQHPATVMTPRVLAACGLASRLEHQNDRDADKNLP